MNETFRPSLRQGTFSAKGKVTMFKDQKPTKPTIKLFNIPPRTNPITTHKAQTTRTSIGQDDINQLNCQIPSMRARGHKKTYDPSRFSGQLSGIGLSHEEFKRDFGKKLAIRPVSSKKTFDSSNIKSIVFNQ